ncbi:MAG: CotH kinase family protein [Oscillospiraceae bacterium]|nr:CotH kinase family protein [Oscillospiraceae bacterium]
MKTVSQMLRRSGIITLGLWLAVLAVISVTVLPASAKVDRRGYVAGKDKIGVEDARMVLQHIVGKKLLTPAQEEAADIDMDGKITVNDARWILQYVVDKINSFPPWIYGGEDENTIVIGEYTDYDTYKYHGEAFAEEPGNNGDALAKGLFGKFLIRQEENPQFPYNVSCYVCPELKEVSALLPAGVDLTAVVPVFTLPAGASVVDAAGEPVASGVTALDLSGLLNLKIITNGIEVPVTIRVETLKTGLPTVSVVTDDMEAITSRTEYVPVSFYAGGGDSELCDYAQIQPVMVDAEARGRGNTSWGFPKKQFKIKLASKEAMLGMPRAKDWALINNYEDKSLIRNQLGQYLAELVDMEFVMQQRQVDFFYNGRYMGTYLLSEHKEVDENRINIPDYYPGAVPGEIGYLVEFDGHCPERVSIDTWSPNYARRWAECERPLGGRNIGYRDYDQMSSDNPEYNDRWLPYYHAESDRLFFQIPIGGKWVSIKNPKYLRDLTDDPDHIRYIHEKVFEAIMALYSGDYSRIDELMDVRSFVKWYIVQEFMNNTDSSFHGSCFMYLEPDGKFKLGPVWDFDRSSGNCDYWNPGEYPGSLYNAQSAWFFLLFDHPEARAILREEWAAFYSKTADLSEWIYDKYELVNDSQYYNYRIWPTLSTQIGANPPAVVAARTYSAQVRLLQSWVSARRPRMNNFYNEILG